MNRRTFLRLLGAAAAAYNVPKLPLKCMVPPPGWWCSREFGHDGPCAALPEPGVSYRFVYKAIPPSANVRFKHIHASAVEHAHCPECMTIDRYKEFIDRAHSDTILDPERISTSVYPTPIPFRYGTTRTTLS